MWKYFILIVLLGIMLAACQNDENGSSDGAPVSGPDNTELVEVVQEPTAVPPTSTPLPTAQPLPQREFAGHIYPVSTRTIHVVQPGDTLSVIARQYGVTVKEVSDANRIYNFDMIYVGDTLYIPPCKK